MTEHGAFIVKEFDMTDFQENVIEISLRESNNNRRRRRNAIEAFALLKLNTTYRTAQVNRDSSEVGTPSLKC